MGNLAPNSLVTLTLLRLEPDPYDAHRAALEARERAEAEVARTRAENQRKQLRKDALARMMSENSKALSNAIQNGGREVDLRVQGILRDLFRLPLEELRQRAEAAAQIANLDPDNVASRTQLMVLIANRELGL